MKRKYAAGVLVLGVVIAAGVFYSTPYIALYAIHRAVERNDAEAVSRYVDFPALRENIREKVLAQMPVVAPESSSSGRGLGDLGQRLAMAAANQMVDRMVSPEGVMMLMEGKVSLQQLPQLPQLSTTPQAQQPPAGSLPPPTQTPPDPQVQEPVTTSVDRAQARNRARDVRVSYQGWSKVRVGVPREPGGLIFRRDGLWGWRLVAVELPELGRV